MALGKRVLLKNKTLHNLKIYHLLCYGFLFPGKTLSEITESIIRSRNDKQSFYLTLTCPDIMAEVTKLTGGYQLFKQKRKPKRSTLVENLRHAEVRES